MGQIDFDLPDKLGHPDWGSAIAADDFDHDGLLDLAIPRRGVGVEILRNNGDGTFTTYGDTGLSAAGRGNLLVAHDIDFDGDADLVWATTGYPSKVYLARNDGNGRSWTTSRADAEPGLTSFTVGNIDRDSDVDVILTTGSGVSVMEVDGSALRRPRILYDRSFDDYGSVGLTTGDFDLDGDQDIAALFVDGDYYTTYTEDYYKVWGAEVTILWNDGTGHFPKTRTVELPYENRVRLTPREIRAGDMDGDHDLDLVVLVGNTDFERTSIPAEFRVIENVDDGDSFTVGQAYQFGHGDAWAIELGDIDTNGTIDVIGATVEQQAVHIRPNRPEGGFDIASTFLTANNETVFVQTRDISDDGQLDILIAGPDDISLLDNQTPLPNLPSIHAPVLYRGEQAEIQVRGLRPNEQAWLGVTNRGWMPTRGIPEFGGLTFDLAGPLLTTVRLRADADGNATVRASVPGDLREGLVIFQLGVRRGIDGDRSVKSPFETTVIVDR